MGNPRRAPPALQEGPSARAPRAAHPRWHDGRADPAAACLPRRRRPPPRIPRGLARRGARPAPLGSFLPVGPLSRQLGELGDLSLEARELERVENDVEQDDSEDDEIDHGCVLLRARHWSASLNSRRRASRRLPESSFTYNVAASASMPTKQTPKVVNWLAVRLSCAS